MGNQKEYILFLDESKDTPPSDLFALGGCAIEKELYKNEIIPYINNLKEEVFGNKEINLHETDIRKASIGDYRVMRLPEKRTLFWSKMEQLFSIYDIKVFNVVINPSMCRNTYKSQYLNDEYFIALQLIIENYVHYLEKMNGVGTICIESRNKKEDNRLSNHHNKLLKHGTLYLNNCAMRKYISTLNFYEKHDNIIGLQIADFIPNVMKKDVMGLNQRIPSIVTNIRGCLYDGCVSEPNRFGNKKVF